MTPGPETSSKNKNTSIMSSSQHTSQNDLHQENVSVGQLSPQWISFMLDWGRFQRRFKAKIYIIQEDLTK